MPDSLSIREHNGTWCVSTRDNTDIVSFAGPGARERAERQRQELLDLLRACDAEPMARVDGDGGDKR
jgi:hypothetical protein